MGFKISNAPERRTTLTALELTPAAGAQPARTINVTFSWDKLTAATHDLILRSDKTKKADVWAAKIASLADIIHTWNVKDETGGSVDATRDVVLALPALVIDRVFDAVKPAATGSTGYMIDVAAFFN